MLSCFTKKLSIRALSLVLACTFFIDQSLFAQVHSAPPDHPIPLKQDISESFLNRLNRSATVNDVFIPDVDASSIDTAIRNPDQKLVIYIEDAHGNISAQKNIAKTIELLSKQASLKNPWVALEGTGTGEIDHKILSAFPDKPVRNIAAEYFLRRGLLNGADYFAARFNPKARLFGVDAGDLADKNRQSYRDFLKSKQSIEIILSKLSNAAAILKKKIYNEYLFELDQLEEQLQKNSHRFWVHLAQLESLAQRNGIPLESYPLLVKLLKVKDLDAKISSSELEREKRHAQMLEIAASLEGPKLFDQITALLDAVWEKQLFYPEAQDARLIDKTIRFYRKLFEFSLTPEEHELYIKHKESDSLTGLQKKIEKYSFLLQPKEMRSTANDFAALKRSLKYPLRFYSLARKRNAALTHNLIDLFDRNPAKKTFFISGGFHREDMAAKLKAKNIPYMVLSPKITSQEGQENYWRLLGGDASDLLPWSILTSTVQLEDSFKNPLFRETVASYLLSSYSRREPSQAISPSILGAYLKNLDRSDRSRVEAMSSETYQRSEVRATIMTQAVGIPNTKEDAVQKLTQFVNDLMNQVSMSVLEIPSPDALLDKPALIKAFNYMWDMEIKREQAPDRKQNLLLVAQRFVKSFNGKTLAVAFRESQSKPVEISARDPQHKSLILSLNVKVLKDFYTQALIKKKAREERASKKPESAEIVAIPDLPEILFVLGFRDWIIGHVITTENKNDRHARDKELISKLLEDLDKHPIYKSVEPMAATKIFINSLLKAIKGNPASSKDDYLVLLYTDLMRNIKASAVTNEDWETGTTKSEMGGAAIQEYLSLLQTAEARIEKIVKAAVEKAEAEAKGQDATEIVAKTEAKVKVEAQKAIFSKLPPLHGKFKIQYRLGEGGFGNAYLAYNLNLGNRPVVVKVTNESIHVNGADENQGARLFREWFYLDELTAQGFSEYPSIIERGGLTPDHPPGYITMRYIKGMPLNKLLKSLPGNKLPLERAVSIIIQLNRGLHVLHNLKSSKTGEDIAAVHRDIKPANLMVSDKDAVTVLDLGLVKPLKEAVEEQQEAASRKDVMSETQQGESPPLGVTQVGKLPGTPDYIPPERFMIAYQIGDKPVVTPLTPASDVFSVGITLYEAVTGRIPANPERHIPGKRKPYFGTMIDSSTGNYLSAKEYAPEIDDILNFIISKSISPAYPEMSDTYWESLFKLGPLKVKDPFGRSLDGNNPVDLAKIRKKEVLFRYGDMNEFNEDLQLWQKFRQKGVTSLKSFLTEKQKAKANELKQKAVALKQKSAARPSVQQATTSPQSVAAPRRSWKKLLLGGIGAGILSLVMMTAVFFIPGKGTVEKTAPPDTTKKGTENINLGKSLKFNGTDTYIRIPNSPSLNPSSGLTIALWFTMERTGPYSYNMLVSKPIQANWAPPFMTYSLRLRGDNSLEGSVTGTQTGVIVSRTKLVPDPNTWRWIVVTFDGKNQNLYLDNKLDVSKIFLERINLSNEDLFLGTHHGKDASNQFHKGKMSNVHIYNRALSQEELTELSKNPGSIKNGLMGHWPLNDIVDGKVKDLSGNNNHGQVIGKPEIVNDSPFKQPSSPNKEKDAVKPRSELRQQPIAPKPFYDTAISDKGNAVVLLPYDEKIIQNIFGENYLPVGNMQLVLLAPKGEEYKTAKTKYGHLEKIYGFRIISSNLKTSQLRLGSPELQNVLGKAAGSFGVPLAQLGRPVIFAEQFELEAKSKPEDLKENEIIYLRYDKQRFVRELPYRVAYLITAAALSKKVYDMISGLNFSEKGISLTESFIRSFQDKLQAVFTLARSA